MDTLARKSSRLFIEYRRKYKYQNIIQRILVQLTIDSTGDRLTIGNASEMPESGRLLNEPYRRRAGTLPYNAGEEAGNR